MSWFWSKHMKQGDVNALFTFLFDSIVNIFVLSGLLLLIGFPEQLINERIIPGAITGIIVGNLLFSVLAYRKVPSVQQERATAIPLGLDLATTVSFTLSVLAPLYLGLSTELGDKMQAGEITWMVGMASTLWMGLVKFLASFAGDLIKRFLPVTALIGTMFGIALVWLGAEGALGLFELPIVGLVALMIMAYSLIGGRRFPFGLPAAFIAIILASLVYYVVGLSGGLTALGHDFSLPQLGPLGFHLPEIGWFATTEFLGRGLNYLAISVPLAILVASTSINISASATLIDDHYKASSVMRVDALATLSSAFAGGVIQTTPYLSHITYKRMGAGVGYSLGVAFLLILLGYTGLIQWLLQIIPHAAIKPILLVVATDMVRLTFTAIPSAHAPAIGFATLPAIFNFAYTKVAALYEQGQTAAEQLGVTWHGVLSAQWLQDYLLLSVLARGYILTAMLWSACIVFILEKKLLHAAQILLVAAGCAYFGVIHSVLPSSSVYLPWELDVNQVGQAAIYLPRDLAIGYCVAMLTLLFIHALNQMNLKSERSK